MMTKAQTEAIYGKPLQPYQDRMLKALQDPNAKFIVYPTIRAKYVRPVTLDIQHAFSCSGARLPASGGKATMVIMDDPHNES